MVISRVVFLCIVFLAPLGLVAQVKYLELDNNYDLENKTIELQKPQAHPEYNCNDNKHPDYDALMAIFNSTNGRQWNNKKGWLDGYNRRSCDPCKDKWHGIEECKNGRVSVILLNQNELKGMLPSLDGLDSLRWFEASYNELEGTIPELHKLVRLISFVAEHNSFTQLPSLDKLKGLHQLKVNDNRLIGEISDVSKMKSLTHFDVEKNKLTGSFPDVSNIDSLFYFNISYNSIAGTISSLNNLQNLKYVVLSKNKLSGPLPPGLSQLLVFYGHSNNFSDCIPQEYGNNSIGFNPDTSSYRGLGYNFKYNPLLPYQGDLSKIINFSKQVGLPCGEDNKRNIQVDCSCDIQYNCTNNKHPDYDALMALYDSTNGADWMKKSGWEKGKAGTSCNPCQGWYGLECDDEGRVSRINLGENNLTGSIPKQINSLKKLKYLNLSTNSLGGSIPRLDSLGLLEHLYLYENSLNKELPNLHNLGYLKYLVCRDNKLSGRFPDLSALKNLVAIDCHNNRFTGPLPGGMDKLEKIETFYLMENDFSGCFPSEVNDYVSKAVYKFLRNPKLPYQGDLSKIKDFNVQTDSECDDGIEETEDDKIQEDCSCKGTIPCNPSIITRENITSCEPFQWRDGKTYMETKMDIDYKNTTCDTLFILNLSILEPVSTVIDTSICPNTILSWAEQSIEESGTYTHVFELSNTCDSTVTLNVSIKNQTNEACTTGITFLEESKEFVVTPEHPLTTKEIGSSVASIAIYGRWGNRVVYRENPDNSFQWIGKSDRGEALPEGPYYYIIRRKEAPEGEKTIIKGYISFFR